MFPPTCVVYFCRSISPSSAVVVDFPFVPVTPVIGARQRSMNKRISVVIGICLCRANSRYRDFGGTPASPLGLLLARGVWRSFSLRVFLGDLGRVPGLSFRDVPALLADDRDRLADLDLLPLAGEDLEQDSGGLRLDLLRHLLRVE